MPELPEVETTRRGLAPHIVGRRVENLVVREGRLRWPVAGNLAGFLCGGEILELGRRGKYLLFRFSGGSLILHLGMSGSLRLVRDGDAVRRHDHVDIVLDNGFILRYHDPRRFGLLQWTEEPARHPLLAGLGPEPLGDAFTPEHLRSAARGRRIAVKPFLMDASIVVGVGNIYANEALFLGGVHPAREAGGLTFHQCDTLVATIRQVLTRAIDMGGTTLRDFVNGHGQPGYFQQTLHVYGRDGQPCTRCGGAIERLRLGQRASYFCPVCQC